MADNGNVQGYEGGLMMNIIQATDQEVSEMVRLRSEADANVQVLRDAVRADAGGELGRNIDAWIQLYDRTKGDLDSLNALVNSQLSNYGSTNQTSLSSALSAGNWNAASGRF